ncbi:MAG: AI-2E family transporter [Patescibacteria group bacterium]|nr:AI-2E family transporter [Patescibacteria group bacterium]MDE2144885.1 AI-2E family transporter [Patescibacteria group bacterium]
MEKEKLTIDISWGSIWKVLAVLALVLFIYLAKEAVIAFIVALIIAAAMDGFVTRLEKWKIPRILSTIMVFLALFVSLFFLIYNVAPLAIFEFSNFLNHFSSIAGQFLKYVNVNVSVPNISSPSLENLVNMLLSGNVSFFQLLGKFLGGAAYAVSVIILSFYLTTSKGGAEKFLLSILPVDVETKALALYHRSKRKISRWAEAQILLCLIVGLMVFLGLYFMGVHYSLLLGVVAGVLELVPIVGPIFSGSLAVVAALTTSLPLGVYTLIYFLAVSQVESNILVPVIMKKAIEIHPAIVLLSLLAGFEILGYVGLVLAVPLAAFFGEVIEAGARQKISHQSSRLML